MKIEIEKRINKGTSFMEFNTILHAVKNCGFENVHEVADALNNIPKFRTIVFGCGSNHMWVKELVMVKQKWYDFTPAKLIPDEKRLMIITN